MSYTNSVHALNDEEAVWLLLHTKEVQRKRATEMASHNITIQGISCRHPSVRIK